MMSRINFKIYKKSKIKEMPGRAWGLGEGCHTNVPDNPTVLDHPRLWADEGVQEGQCSDVLFIRNHGIVANSPVHISVQTLPPLLATLVTFIIFVKNLQMILRKAQRVTVCWLFLQYSALVQTMLPFHMFG
jgi:hypothetical protein